MKDFWQSLQKCTCVVPQKCRVSACTYLASNCDQHILKTLCGNIASGNRKTIQQDDGAPRFAPGLVYGSAVEATVRAWSLAFVRQPACFLFVHQRWRPNEDPDEAHRLNCHDRSIKPGLGGLEKKAFTFGPIANGALVPMALWQSSQHRFQKALLWRNHDHAVLFLRIFHIPEIFTGDGARAILIRARSHSRW